MDLLSPDLVDRLREALSRAGFGYDAVAGLLGPTAHAALGRNETTPGLRATRGGSPLETLARLWPLQATVATGPLEEPGRDQRLDQARQRGLGAVGGDGRLERPEPDQRLQR